MILDGAQTRKIRRDGYGQNRPPHRLLIPHVVAEPSEEEQERELDGPEPRVEKDNHDDGSAQVPRRTLRKIYWGWEDLARGDPNVEIQIVFAHLPYYAVYQEQQAGEEDQGVVCEELVEGLDSDADTSSEEY